MAGTVPASNNTLGRDSLGRPHGKRMSAIGGKQTFRSNRQRRCRGDVGVLPPVVSKPYPARLGGVGSAWHPTDLFGRPKAPATSTLDQVDHLP